MRRFRAILAREGVETDEGWLTRVFPAGCFEWNDAATHPMTVNHDDSALNGTVLGMIETIERLDTLIIGRGFLDDEGEGAAADLRRDLIRQIDQKMINAVSVEPSGLDVEETCTEEDEDGWCTAVRVTFTRYEIGAASVVTIPGIEGTLIELDPPEGLATPNEDDAVAASAAATLEHPPLAWFEMDEPDELTPLTITADGRVFGHLASWDQCHLGFPNTCVTAWRSPTEYSYFHLCGPIQAQGELGLVDLRVGPISGGGGHFTTAGESARDWRSAQAHYDNPDTCAAYVRAIDGELGPWVSGAVRHGASAEQIAFLRQHPPSGDWRRIEGQMELVGVCSVNVPGFPVRQAIAASAAPDGTLEPFAAVMTLARNCSECGEVHETPPDATASVAPQSMTAAAMTEELAGIRGALAVLLEDAEPRRRERALAKLHAAIRQ